MSKKSRQHRTPEQNAQLLRRHLVDKVPVSDLCNEHDLQPSVFYRWLQLFENAPTALSTQRAFQSRAGARAEGGRPGAEAEQEGRRDRRDFRRIRAAKKELGDP
jgi:transposase-like protein